MPVVRGLGIFLTNATLAERTHGTAPVSWWSMSRNGYLPSRIFGYALAVFAWLRGEERPEWARHLRGDALAVLNAGLKFLNRTRDCRCQPPGSRDGIAPSRLVERLTSPNPGVFLAALWELRRPDSAELSSDEWSALVGCLDRRDPLLVCEAALTIAARKRRMPKSSTDVSTCCRGSGETQLCNRCSPGRWAHSNIGGMT